MFAPEKEDKAEASLVPKSQKSSTSIEELPEDVLLEIFAKLEVKDLYFSVRPVCRQWNTLAMSVTLWKRIEADNDIPTKILLEWIKSARILKTFVIKNRKDANIIVNELAKNSKFLESVKMMNCQGSADSSVIGGTSLCHLAQRCPKLYKFDFTHSRINSKNFFRIISKGKCIGNTKRSCYYYGAVTASQIMAYVSDLHSFEENETSCIHISGLPWEVRLQDLARHIQTHKSRMTAQQIWSYIYRAKAKDMF